ncbi:fimbria/pilus outer membrane usher protein [Variovorax sp. Varisp41]|uniref:fimbria/pilus outer membrane usher protein n=1 Tax=Variovorax sp. Varisp41 TaxID=3243033 RepID=UPI0039B65452
MQHAEVMRRILRAAPFRRTLCATVIASLGIPALAQQVAGSRFEEEFLGIGGGKQPRADLSIFAFGNRVLPGTYAVDVTVNGRAVGRSTIRFDDVPGTTDAVACLTRGMLDGWGVNVEAFPALAGAADDVCVDLPASIPEATVSYDAGQLALSLGIPQAALKRAARGAVEPARWDRGITAAMLDYQLNFARHGGDNQRERPNLFANSPSLFDANPFLDRRRQDAQRNTLFAGLRGGFNIGDWRLRHYSTYNRDTNGRGRWQAVTTTLQRDLPSIQGQLQIGDGNTPANFFDSVPFRGVQIGTDEAMLSDSQQGYAPTIRGIAQTNARVTVRQSGYVVYSTFVAPGPFVIDDLYPTDSGGDLEVTVTEADGRESRYIQAFSAVPTLLREGTWRYGATVGKYRSAFGYSSSYIGDMRQGGAGTLLAPWLREQGARIEPVFVQATLARGLGNDYTVYGGFMASSRYQSVLAGVGRNMRSFGALSLDLSTASTTAPRGLPTDPAGTPMAFALGGKERQSGQSLRFLYAKSFVDSGTNFRVAGYRYSTSGYRTFQEAVDMQALSPSERLHSRRNELRFELAQKVGDWGSLFASARQQSYWGTSFKDRLVQVGWSGSYKQFSYSVFYNRSAYQDRRATSQLMFTLSIPLGTSAASAQYAVSRDREGNTSQQVSLYGAALEDRRLSYSVSASHASEQGAGGSVGGSYLAPFGRFDLGHSQGRGFRQTTFGMAGGLLVHGGGITLSQPLGETVALVQVPKAGGVGFDARPGVVTDGSGSAVIPNLSPYRLNRVAVRTQDLGDTTEVKSAATELVPTRGAVVLTTFETSVGYRLMLTLTDGRGQPLPFGARIENDAGQEVGIVGPEGRAYVTGAGQNGRLAVRWGQRSANQCAVSYSLPEEASPSPVRQFAGRCTDEAQAVSLKGRR